MNCRAFSKASLHFFLLLLLTLVARAEDRSIVFVDLFLNDLRVGDALVLRDQNDSYYVEQNLLRDWQIAQPWPKSVSFRGKSYHSVNALAGATAALDERTMILRITVPANLLPLRTKTLQPELRTASTAEMGAYLDYDINLLRQSSGQSSYALLSPVIFGAGGNLAAKLNYQQLAESPYSTNNASDGLHVLSLTYTRDDTSRMRTLEVGDIVTSPGSQGYSLRLGGVQFGSNFATQPTFITYPLPSFYGETTVPSALDIYVNGRLRRTEEVDAGRYLLEDIPVVNGEGQMQIITRDAMGRRQVFAQDFYVASDLLREGLSDYSVSFGALREDYGVEDFKYGDLAGSASWRYGWSDDLTVEGHGEFSSRVFMTGAAAQYSLPWGGTAKAGVAVSRSQGATGGRWQLGYRRVASLLNFNVEISGSTQYFDVVAQYSATPKLQLVASAGKNFYEYGSIGASLVWQSYHDQQPRTLLMTSYSKTFRNALSLMGFVSFITADRRDVTAGIRFSLPFGKKFSSYGGISASDSGLSMNTTLRRSLPAGEGYGYHVGVGSGNNPALDTGLIFQTEVGTYSLDARQDSQGNSTLHASTQGSVGYLSGVTSFSRRIRDAFAVVSVGGMEGVRVYSENREVGRTNKEGKLFVPGLLPYYSNRLHIAIDDLPLNARIGMSEVRTSPGYRSGVYVDFDVSVSRSVLFRAVLPDGSAVPEGAHVRLQNDPHIRPVGIDGRVYLDGIDASSVADIRWNGRTCSIDIPFPQGGAIVSRMGDLECKPGSVR